MSYQSDRKPHWSNTLWFWLSILLFLVMILCIVVGNTGCSDYITSGDAHKDHMSIYDMPPAPSDTTEAP